MIMQFPGMLRKPNGFDPYYEELGIPINPARSWDYHIRRPWSREEIEETGFYKSAKNYIDKRIEANPGFKFNRFMEGR